MLKKIILSPLTHFFIIGGLIFAAFAMLNTEEEKVSADEIIFTQQDADAIIERFEGLWARKPNEEELDNLIKNWVKDEIYVKEALSLGLDRDDAIIEQRLQFKMRFLIDSGAKTLSPTDAELQEYLDDNRNVFTYSAGFAFEQVLLPEDGNIEDIKQALNNGTNPAEINYKKLLPIATSLAAAPVIDQVFGEGFHTQLVDLPLNEWHGPVNSGYGQHLVRIHQRTEATLPQLAEIRDAVEERWRNDKGREMRESFEEVLLNRYQVKVPSAKEVLAP